jgi:1-deoxy-D-xylulose-5-phosphate synthase
MPPLVRLGLPDRFVEHGERGELLAEISLDAAGIAAACRSLASRQPLSVTVGQTANR